MGGPGNAGGRQLGAQNGNGLAALIQDCALQ
jgi:hypothetical protein